MPQGVQAVMIDPESSQLATSSCPVSREEVYVQGSAPTQLCEIHGAHGIVSSAGSFLSHIFGGSPKQPADLPKTGTFPSANGGENPQPWPHRQALFPRQKTAPQKKKKPSQKSFLISCGQK